MAELKKKHVQIALGLRSRSQRDPPQEILSFVRFFLEPKSFKIPPTKCQKGPIGHLYDLGWSMGSPWWPYGGRLSDPFSEFLAPTSALAKKKTVIAGFRINPHGDNGP